jgi:transposase
MFVGMDVHKNYLQIAVLDENGKVLNNSRVDNNPSKIAKFFDRLDHRKSTKIVMESSGMWYNIYECLNKRHLDIRLSNPAKTRAIASAKIKTDKLDAVKLADLLRGVYIAECYIPTKETPICGSNFNTPVIDQADYTREIHYRIGDRIYIENAD